MLNTPQTRPSSAAPPVEKSLWVNVAGTGEAAEFKLDFLDQSQVIEWSVPSRARPGDFVLMYVAGGIGFAYIFEVAGRSRKAKSNEFGPVQAPLRKLANISAPVGLPTLREDPVLRSWTYVLRNMQGIVRNQRESLTDQADIWNSLESILLTTNPDLQSILSSIRSQTGPTDTIPRVYLNFTLSRQAWALLLRAAAISRVHRPSQRQLTLSSLFFALVDAAERRADDVPNMSQILYEFIRDDPDVMEAYANELHKYLETSTPNSFDTFMAPAVLFESTPSSNVSALMQQAELLATSLSQSKKICARHLLGALISFKKVNRTELDEQVERIGIDLPTIRTRLYERLKEILPGEASRWQTVLLVVDIELYEPRIAGYDSEDSDDAQRSDDYLHITPEAKAFATLLASRATEPPISIAVFGEWGSGKSYFMRQIRHEIEALVDTHPAYCQSVLCICFNAWHYVDDNLWAAMARTVNEALFKRLVDDASPQTKREALTNQLIEAQGFYDQFVAAAGKAQSKYDTASSALTDAGTKLHRAQQAVNQVATAAPDSEISQQIREIGRDAGIKPNDLDQFQKNVVGGAALASVSAQAAAAIQKNPRAWLFVLGAFGLTTALAVYFLNVQAISQAIGADLKPILEGGLPVVAAVATFIVQMQSHVAKIKERIVDVQQEERRRGSDRMQEAKKELDEATQLALKAKLDIERRQRQLAEAGDIGLRFSTFVRERGDSNDYQPYMGLISLVRKDFSALDSFLRQGGVLPVNRIVLFIDDLDRCQPSRVVSVLEAVHLLLAFPSFSVVVGVDARWLTGSILTRLPTLSSEASETSHPAETTEPATPLDYMEKIFQIPYWTRPIDVRSAAAMLRGLADAPPSNGSVNPKPNGQASSENAGDNAAEDDRAFKKAVDGGDIPADQPEGAQSAARDKSSTRSGSSETNAATSIGPESVAIDAKELAFMEGLANSIGKSPRRIKRFLNSYRIIKASLSIRAAASYLDTAGGLGEYKAVIALLALLTGAPVLAPYILKALREAQSGTELHVFRSSLLHLSRRPFEREYQTAMSILDYYQTSRGDNTTIDALMRWTDKVARYSFQPQIA
jgi:KAP-like P-loop domain-containing protein